MQPLVHGAPLDDGVSPGLLYRGCGVRVRVRVGVRVRGRVRVRLRRWASEDGEPRPRAGAGVVDDAVLVLLVVAYVGNEAGVWPASQSTSLPMAEA